MLRKILEDMFVPDEILNNISDDDKQLIFLEIRKEQIRRYNTWQCMDKSSEEFVHKPNLKGKNIKFVDDTELVSILGERLFDRPIEDILKEEALKRAQDEAERVVLAELGTNKCDLINQPPVEEVSPVPSDVVINIVPAIDNTEPIAKTPPVKAPKPVNQRITRSAEQKREDMLKRKSTEIYQSFLSQQSFLEETAIKENEELTPIWEKAAEQARNDDEQRRKKALEARKFYATIGKERGTSVNDEQESQDKGAQPPPPVQKSSQLRYVLSAISNFEILSKTGKDKVDIKAWFLENEWNKKRIIDSTTNKVPDWFHGMITRPQAEKCLSDKEIGSFLIRVSEKCCCYVLSYKTKSKVKHILIQSKTECDEYEFLGPPNKITFKSLKDLIVHFQSHVISDSNKDVLTSPCGQVPDSIVDYMSLIQPDCSQGDKKTVHKCAV